MAEQDAIARKILPVQKKALIYLLEINLEAKRYSHVYTWTKSHVNSLMPINITHRGLG